MTDSSFLVTVRRALLAIAVITVVTGLSQLFAPALMLRILSAEVTPTSSHFFAIVGMFMTLFGGLLLHALLRSAPQPIPVFWCGLQKLGAAVAVSIGVVGGLFAWLALAVAAFDLFSAGLIFFYWYTIRRPMAQKA